ncbi:Bifunctional purine biosynthesis protein PurH, partial [Coemansia spiralis]
MTPDLAGNTQAGAPASFAPTPADEPAPLPHTAIYGGPGCTAGSAPSSTNTEPVDTRHIPAMVTDRRSNSGNSLSGEKIKPEILEGDERGISRLDSRYSRLNRSLLLCAIAVALSSINYGWVIGSVNIPALVIEECSDGPETWTSGFPSCIPMGSIMWGLVVGLTPLGAWAGSMFSGVAADRYGRKRILIINNAFFIAGALLSSTSTSVAQLGTGRFVSGIGCGVAANL